MDRDKYFAVKEIKGRKQSAIAPATAQALISFCEQEPEFEQAVEQSGKTFSECLDSVVEKTGNSISDLEVYRKAVAFYFSTATVHFNMSIDLCGENEKSITMTQSRKAGLSVSLDDLLDF